MPDTRVKPVPASELSASEEASKLEEQLQRQLEDDVARIFDESIYSDLEVACGKLKVLTHSCILKARTNQFYRKLETFLHANIGRKIFDEIYSFISDAYTECNIKHQEKEIIEYLNDNLNIEKKVDDPKPCSKTKEVPAEETDVYLTPKGLSPFAEQEVTNCLSPSTELTKEYYALVPIDGQLLEQELNEQDALSNAFQTIIKTQVQDTNNLQTSPRNKPTTLSLTSSHSSKIIKHSNSCDTLVSASFEDAPVQNEKLLEKKKNTFATQKCRIVQAFESIKATDHHFKNLSNGETVVDKVIEPAYSPDSLITDDPSSSSDYLSAALTCSPGISSSVCHPQLNVGETITKMDNVFTSSDSGLENTGMLESLSSHKDVTLTDISLTESTLHELTSDDLVQAIDAATSPIAESQLLKYTFTSAHIDKASLSSTSTETSNGLMHPSSKLKDTMAGKSSKEEKQRQNEEIVILESSSVSSETGSWESVFPPKLAEKEICEKFINNERQFSHEHSVNIKKEHVNNYSEDLCPSLVQKSPFKSTSCFIDAASLADEEDDAIQQDQKEVKKHASTVFDTLPAPSQPVPCTTVHKQDISPNDWSESNEIEDSLEQGDNKDPDSIQKDMSPTIFEMTPITDDSFCTNVFENAGHANENKEEELNMSQNQNKNDGSFSSTTVFMSDTPHNSIMSLKNSAISNKPFDSEESESDVPVAAENDLKKNLSLKYNESSPIISGGASIEDHLPNNNRNLIYSQETSDNLSSKADIGNNRKSPKSVSAWVVDMSGPIKPDDRNTSGSAAAKKPADRTCENLKNESKCIHISENNNKSRSSVDSDSSEKSSHKFYIDLSSLPDPLPTENIKDAESQTSEKKNIFSMYIDLGEKSTVKEMPLRLSSAISTKKQSTPEVKGPTVKVAKNLCNEPALNKITDQSSSVKTFEKYESLCNDPNIRISEIIAITEESPKPKIIEAGTTKKSEHFRCLNGEKAQHNLATTIIEEEPTISRTPDLFVKLSDLDKPAVKTDITLTSKKDNSALDVRMTRSIPENNWGGNHATASRSSEIMSSFHSENALSLNRLFPHLKNEFSKSMPGSLSGRTQSPLRQGASSSHGELDEQTSDMSEMSSVQSSICRSVVDNSTTEDTSQTSSLIASCQSRLGQDLLRMFLEEIAPDVIVEVSGKRIKAHKCILSSRCQYFAGILSGGWVESAGNVIILPPFSHNVVQFVLCHIYSGISVIPDTISIVELATIADMLGLEGLKEAIMFTLKTKYCHHFHRPCQVCIAGVLECFPLTSVYGLDDLYRKCLRWITKYFPKVWPTKAFATLPKELLEKCYQEQIIYFSTDTFIDTVYGCGITVASLQNSRWAENVARLCKRLMNAAAYYAAGHLVEIFKAISSIPAEAPRPAKHALEECLTAAIEWAPSEETCRAYAYLSALVKEMRQSQFSKPDLISNGNQAKASAQNNLLYTHGSCWRLQCEGALVRAAPRVVGTQAFKDLPSDLRKRLRELGCIMYGAQAIPVTPFPHQDRKKPHHNKAPKSVNPSTSRNLDMEHVRALFVPYASKPVPQVHPRDVIKSNNDLKESRKSARANPPKVRTTKAQEERAKFNLIKTNQSQERINIKSSAPRLHPFQNTKPRYLEPRPCKDNEKKMPPKKLLHKMMSSSESSRNSSPVQTRNLRASRAKSSKAALEAKAQAMSQDSLATTSRPRTAEPSTDSLSESQASNKYATYTKARHAKGSNESIKTGKCQPTASGNGTGKTKIPVLVNQISKSENHGDNKRYNSFGKASITSSVPSSSHKEYTRKTPGSLMNATKASQAKMVPKVNKECKGITMKHSKYATKHVSRQASARVPEIPVMERSGTFLKDEPTFGDKTTNVDIGQ